MIKSILTNLLGSHDELQVFIQEISEVGVVVCSLKLQREQLNNMFILNFHSGKESIEVLNVFEDRLLVNLREHLVKLVKVRSDEIQLLPAVETSHLSSSLIN